MSAMQHARVGSGLKDLRRRILSGESLDDLSPLHASWQRSIRFGLDEHLASCRPPYASLVGLRQALEESHDLVRYSKPVLDLLSVQTRGSDCIILLADSDGIILLSSGDDSFTERATRLSLKPGSNWHEKWRGTNAIGTTLATGQAFSVDGFEHFLVRNFSLSCSATPIKDSRNEIKGALNISGRRGRIHPHTLGLVATAARQIERQLFMDQHASDIVLHIHASLEGLGTLGEGLLAFSNSGILLGANYSAIAFFGIENHEYGKVMIEQLVDVNFDQLLMARARRKMVTHPIRKCNVAQLHFWTDFDPDATKVGLSPTRNAPGPIEFRDPLAALGNDDPALSVAASRARKVIGKSIPLLILGESGTGKEVFAKACHDSSNRCRAPFVAVNCAALPEQLIESELFGYKGGAFTGANKAGSIGRIREAHGGTLFLDEIGDMPLAQQTHLLRVLQERQVTPLGGGAAVSVDIQLICATHCDLEKSVREGRFRSDLYYRINGLSVKLPSLRDRGDLRNLVDAMLRKHSSSRRLEIDEQVMGALQRYHWPGNVRQLASVLQTAIALLDDDDHLIRMDHMPEELTKDLLEQTPPSCPGIEPTVTLKGRELQLMSEALEVNKGNITEAARTLGVSRSTIYRKMQAHGISRECTSG